MLLRDPQTSEFLGIACNSCGSQAPPAAEIAKAHGLIRMGWHCSGGTHLCPEHNPNNVYELAEELRA